MLQPFHSLRQCVDGVTRFAAARALIDDRFSIHFGLEIRDAIFYKSTRSHRYVVHRAAGDAYARRQDVAMRMRALERWLQRWMRVDQSTAPVGAKVGRQNAHESGVHD